MAENGNLRTRGPVFGLGLTLIVVGVLLGIGQILDIRPAQFLWPFFVIIPGLALFAFALSLRHEAGEGLAVAGSIVTTVGLVLLYQNTTGYWQSWAYAWALVGPTASGASLMIYGAVRGKDTATKSGRDVFRVGIIMFAIGAIFFELIIGISGFGLGRMAWALALVGLGAFLLLRNTLFYKGGDRSGEEAVAVGASDTARLDDKAPESREL